MRPVEVSPPEEDLVFVCGALRSGTTLLRLMLNAHPLLTNPGEMDFLFEPPLRSGSPDMAAYARELSFNRVFQKLELRLNPGLDYADQIRGFVSQLRKAGMRLSINVHRHFDRIPAVFPNARYVHLVRDPRDVARSSIAMGWAGNVYHGVDHWIASERDFERLAAAVPASSICRMSSEALVSAPERELTALCRFLGVAYDAKMLEYPSRTTYGPPDPTLIGRWRRELSSRELGLVEGKLGTMLAERGYEPSGAKLVHPQPAERALLKTADRLRRWRFRLKRDGLALTAADVITRRLRIVALADRIRRQRAEIALRHLK